METKPHTYWTPRWLERLYAKERANGSKHANGKQKPRHYRKTLRAQRKRQRVERRKHRFG